MRDLTIPHPVVPPLGFEVTAADLRDAWDSVWAPIYDGPQSIEHRVIAGCLRAVYEGLLRADESEG